MTPREFQEVDRIFQALRRLPPTKRPAALARESNLSDDCRREIEALLSAYDDPKGDAFLDTPALGNAFPVATSADARLPTRIGRYRIIEPLGEGGMARVFVAEQDRPRRRVALKIMRTLLGPRAEKRFELEALVLGRLRHPGIAQIYEAGIHQAGSERLPYIAMELVEGERLTRLVKNRSLDQATTLHLFTRICDAVQHAHQQGVIHRDLKPSNILVEERDNMLLPKLLDLGIARATDLDIQATTMGTSVGELVGTLQYMSPEQAAGDPDDIDTRTDVYSLGAILFELLTETPPLDLMHKPIHEALRTIREDEPPAMRSLCTTLRGDLELIARKAMEKDKGQRYQSARDLADDVRRYLGNEPIMARHPSTAYQLRKFARRNRVLVAGIACFAIAIAIGMTGMIWFAVGKSRALDAESLALSKAIAAQQDAENARRQAERRFEEVRNLASVFINELDGQIRDLPGSTEARQFVVATGLEYLDNLEKEAADDPALQLQLASAYFKLGDIQGFPDIPNLGDREGAWASYQKGLKLLDELRRHAPNDLNIEKIQSVAYCHCAVVLEELNRRQEAEGFHSKAFELIRHVWTEVPADPGVLSDVAYHENRLGDDDWGKGHLGAAEKRYGNARELYERILAIEPDSITAQRGLAAYHDRMARTARARGDANKAIEHFSAFIDATNAIYNHQGDLFGIRADLAVGYEQRGITYRAIGDRGNAMDSFMQSLAIRQADLEADPKNIRAVEGMRAVSCYVGEEALALGRLDEARRRFDTYVQLSRRIAKAEPQNAKARRELAVAYYKMAEWHLASADDAGATVADTLSHRRDALAWLTRCRDEFSAIREEGLLWQSDQGVIAQLAGEIDACQNAIRTVQTTDVLAD